MGFFGELIFGLLVEMPAVDALERKLASDEFKADLASASEQSPQMVKRILTHYDPLKLEGMDECSALYAQVAETSLASVPESDRGNPAVLYSALRREATELSSDVRFTMNKARLRKAAQRIAELASGNGHV